MTGSRIVLTGPRGQGKTTLCRQLADLKASQGWQVAGLLSPARFEAGEKTGILVEEIRTGESRLLASRHAGEIRGYSFGEWVFDPTALDWGNRILQHAGPAGLFIIDEIGPLEFKLGVGWMKAFNLLAKNAYPASLVVVRPEHLVEAETRFGPVQIFQLNNRMSNALATLLTMIPNELG